MIDMAKKRVYHISRGRKRRLGRRDRSLLDWMRVRAWRMKRRLLF